MNIFSSKSKTNLDSCHWDIKVLFNEVIKTYDCSILEGHRSQARQQDLFEAGYSKLQVSKHNKSPSNAVDVSPYPIPKNWGIDDDKERAKFYHFGGFVLGVAEVLKKQGKINREITWGGDWNGNRDFNDQDFNDLIHFELK